MNNIKEDVKLLEEFMINGSLENTYESKITNFSTGRFYTSTTEYINNYVDDSFKDKKLLTVTSSGDHTLESIVYGVKDITCFDINKFSKYMQMLKIAMIKSYDKKEFIDNMHYLIDFDSLHEKVIIVCKLFDKVSKNLDDDANLFWQTYFNLKVKNDFNQLFINNKYFNNELFKNDFYCSYLENKYDVLKQNIDSANIKYIDCDLLELSKLNDKFDIIMLSNIIQSMVCKKKGFRIISDNIIKLAKESKLLNSLQNNLLDEGIIINYWFGLFSYNTSMLNKNYEVNIENKDLDSIITLKKR